MNSAILLTYLKNNAVTLSLLVVAAIVLPWPRIFHDLAVGFVRWWSTRSAVSLDKPASYATREFLRACRDAANPPTDSDIVTRTIEGWSAAEIVAGQRRTPRAIN